MEPRYFIKFLVVLSVILILFALASCSPAIFPTQLPTTTISTTVIPSPTKPPISTLTPIPTLTPTSTLTPTPTLSPTITFSPTPSMPTSCSDKIKTNEVVDAFLNQFSFPTYEAYLASLPPVSFNCFASKCVSFGFFTNFNLSNLNMPVHLIGSFPISLNEYPHASKNDTGICLLFANPDFDTPIPVLGAVEFENQFIVAFPDLSNNRKSGINTIYMPQENFEEWLKLTLGKQSNINVLINYYDSGYYRSNPEMDVSKFLSRFPDVIAEIIKTSYLPKLAKERIQNQTAQESYDLDKNDIKNILSQYDMLFIRSFASDQVKDSDITILIPHSPIIDESSRFVLYDDKTKPNISNKLIEKVIVDLKSKDAAYHGQNGIFLKRTPENFIEFNLSFYTTPIKATDYDYLEFYQRTISQRTDRQYMEVFVNHKGHSWYDEYDRAIILPSINPYKAFYNWFGIINPAPEDKSSRWKLIRIPISSFDKDASGYINGISFVYDKYTNEVYLDEISLVKEIKP